MLNRLNDLVKRAAYLSGSDQHSKTSLDLPLKIALTSLEVVLDDLRLETGKKRQLTYNY